MKHTLLYSFVLASFLGMAQPTITNNVVAPLGATSIYYKSNTFNTFNAGAAGANAVWNFATLDSALGSSIQRTVKPDTCPTYSDFPSVVNRAIQANSQFGPVYAFSFIDNSKYEYYGTENLSLVRIFTDPVKLLAFPFTYNNQFTDYFHDFDSTIFGSTTVKADGYGTLTTPAGTYSNSLRVKVTENYREYIDWDFDGNPIDSFLYEGLYYRWYQPNTPNVLLEYSKLVKYGFIGNTRYDVDSLKHVYYTKNTSTGIDEEAGFQSIMYPNPAGNYVMFNAETVIEKAEVTDLCGKLVKSETFFDKSIMLNLENLSAGAYCVQLSTSDNRKKTVRVQHY